MSEKLSPLERRGYAKSPKLLSSELRELVRKYMDLSHRTGRMAVADNAVIAGQFEQYGALLSESLLCTLRPRIESIVQEELIPSYSFWRIYERGAVLREHVDRAACEIGVSIAIASEPETSIWPLWMRGTDNRVRAVDLRSGDGVVYLGTRVPHWRAPFDGDVQYQMFLHYVRRQGPHAALAYDGRQACGLPSAHSGKSAQTN